MSGKKISVDQLAEAIAQELESYEQETADALKKSAKETAKACKAEIRSSSRLGKTKHHYRDGWAVKILHEDAANIRTVVYNRVKPGLTHLLENGHAKRNGGRVQGYPHIGPAEQHANETFIGEVKKIYRGR